MAITMDVLELEIIDNSTGAANGLNLLSTALNGLKTATANSAGLGKVSKALAGLVASLAPLQNISVPTGKITELTNALKPLTTLGKSSFNSLVTGLSKVGEVTKTLETVDMNKFAAQIQRVVTAMKPLADASTKVHSGLKLLPSAINKVISANGKFVTSNKATTKSFGILGTGISAAVAKIGIAYLAIKKIVSVLGKFINESNAYIENLNLFTVAMGKYADSALKYAESVNAALGIDVSEWIRNQGIFMQMASGFGVAQDKAAQMSKTLTQVSYDLSSFFNIPITDAMQKVQSGLAGELEPLRRLGYALDQATLQQVAYKNGIKANISTMTQAQKSQLRFIAIMEQSGNVVGDMARTIMTPANAMRILQQQFTQLSRAIGNVFIPLLTAVIPYIQAFVSLLTKAINSLAVLFGFEIPKIDYSGLSGAAGAAGDMNDGLQDSADSAKKLKGLLAGFDEFNIIQQEQGGAAGGIGAGDLGIDLGMFDYDFLKDADTGVQEIIKSIEKFFKNIKDFWYKYFAVPFAGAVAKVMPQLKKLSETFKGIFSDIGTLAKPLESWFYNNAIPMFQQLIITGGDVLAGLLDSTNMVISDIWNALFPAIYSFVELALPVITDFVTQAIITFGTFFDYVKSVFDTLWTGAVKPALDLISQIWQDLMKIIKELWDKWGVKTFDNIRQAIETTSELFQSLWNNFLKPVFDNIFKVLKELWDDHLSPLVKQIGEFVLTFYNAAMDIYNQFIAPIAKWFIEIFGPVISERINTAITVIGTLVGVVADVATSAIKYLGGLTEFIAGVFTGDWDRAWNGIKTMFSSVWDKMQSIVKGAWEAITGWIDGIVKTAQKAIDTLLELIGLKDKEGSRKSQPYGRKEVIVGYEFGGFPASGEFFMARENGIPEMVGAIGNRTAVANNDQIVSGITNGVSRANEPVVAAIHAMANAMVNAVVNNQPIVAIGEKEIARVAQAGMNRLGSLATAP